jgi:hypothetical protein
MSGPSQLTFTTLGGETVTVTPRGKHYIQPRGYADHPGTGPKGETCGSCKHHVVKRMGKDYHKCILTQACWTGGRRSDILVRAEACSKWERQP